MNKKKLIIFAFCLLVIPNLAFALNVSFGNPVGTTGDITTFFETVLTGILNIIAFLAVLFIVIGGVIYLMASSSGNDNLVSTAKKIWTGALIGLALALAGPTFLREIKEIVLNGGPMPTSLDDAPTLSEIVTRGLTFLLSIIGLLAIISLTISGISYLSSFGDSTKVEKAKQNIFYALLGILIAGASLILVRQISLFITG